MSFPVEQPLRCDLLKVISWSGDFKSKVPSRSPPRRLPRATSPFVSSSGSPEFGAFGDFFLQVRGSDLAISRNGSERLGPPREGPDPPGGGVTTPADFSFFRMEAIRGMASGRRVAGRSRRRSGPSSARLGPSGCSPSGQPGPTGVATRLRVSDEKNSDRPSRYLGPRWDETVTAGSNLASDSRCRVRGSSYGENEFSGCSRSSWPGQTG